MSLSLWVRPSLGSLRDDCDDVMTTSNGDTICGRHRFYDEFYYIELNIFAIFFFSRARSSFAFITRRHGGVIVVCGMLAAIFYCDVKKKMNFSTFRWVGFRCDDSSGSRNDTFACNRSVAVTGTSLPPPSPLPANCLHKSTSLARRKEN